MDHASAWHVPASGASLYGKLPTVLDYVRVNHSYAAAIALDEWLQRCIQDLTLANLSWTTQPYRFLFVPAHADHAIVGVIVGSRDRAGRKFPLAVFAALPISALQGHLAVVPSACEPFFQAVDALLEDTKALEKDDLPAKLAALPTPSAADFTAASDALPNTLSTIDAASFATSVFGDDAAQQAPRAYAMALSTAYGVREQPAERASVLDCPVRGANDVIAWLGLVQSVLQWRAAAPSLFWTTAGEPGRLLISLGAPPPSLSVWLADRKRKADKLLTLPPLRLSAHADQLLDKLLSVPSGDASKSVVELFAQLGAQLS